MISIDDMIDIDLKKDNNNNQMIIILLVCNYKQPSNLN